MHFRPLGVSGLQVSSLGLGCMGMSSVYGPADDAQSLRVLRRFFELGGNFLDTAERYGPFHNELLLGQFIRTVPRERVVVATKFGYRINETTLRAEGLDSSPANIVRACDASLQRLGVDVIDLFYQHRVDPAYPIEETVSTMADLVKAGKVRALGLSEASARTLRRASKVHPIAALQSEYSLWSRDPETNGVLAACKELGVAFVSYSPLGRGFLTGTINDLSDLPSDDWRRTTPRFQSDAIARNAMAVAELKWRAAAKGCTAGQLALAWVASRIDNIVPIPGSKQIRHLEENMAAVNITISAQESAELEMFFPLNGTFGSRYSVSGMASLDSDV